MDVIFNNVEVSKKTMTVKEFKQAYGFGSNSAYAIIHHSDFPKIRCGRKILIIRSLVDKWLSEHIGHTF